MMTRRVKNIIKITLGVIVLIVVTLAGIMAWTNPDKEEHKTAVAQIVNKYDMNKLNLTEAERDQYINYVCGGSSVNILAKEVMPRFVVDDNNALWSTGYIMVKDENDSIVYKKKVTTGIFNKVSVIDEQELMQTLLEAHRINEKHTAAEAGKQQTPQQQ